jgi:hypothetical protein
VFISYATEDQRIATATCRSLENTGIDWIAILPTESRRCLSPVPSSTTSILRTGSTRPPTAPAASAGPPAQWRNELRRGRRRPRGGRRAARRPARPAPQQPAPRPALGANRFADLGERTDAWPTTRSSAVLSGRSSAAQSSSPEIWSSRSGRPCSRPPLGWRSRLPSPACSAAPSTRAPRTRATRSPPPARPPGRARDPRGQLHHPHGETNIARAPTLRPVRTLCFSKRSTKPACLGDSSAVTCAETATLPSGATRPGGFGATKDVTSSAIGSGSALELGHALPGVVTVLAESRRGSA